MNNNIDLIAFGTFGIPNGFRQSLFIGDKNNFSKIKTFDLNTNAIKLFSGTRVYAIRKQQIDGKQTIAYSIYSFAKEKNSDRGGTFIGSSILFHDKIAKENLTIDCLNEFHEKLITNKDNIEDDIIQVNHSDNFKLSKKPKDFDKLNFNVKKNTPEINLAPSGKDLLVYSLIKSELFEKSLELLNIYDTIFFTKSEDITKFVFDKQLIKVIQGQDFEHEIQAVRAQIEEERKRKIRQAIGQVERQAVQFEETTREYIRRSNQQIEVCKNSIKENEQLIERFVKQTKEDNQQIENSTQLFEKLQNGFQQCKVQFDRITKEIQEETVTPEKGLKELEEYSKKLEEQKNNFRIPTIANLSSPQTANRPTSSFYNSNTDHRKSEDYRTSRTDSEKASYKTIAIVLFLLWMLTIVFFLFFDEIKHFNPL